MDVDITIGSETQVIVEADDNLLPLIDTHVEDDELVIESHGSYSTHRSTKAHVQMPALTKIALDGSGDIRVNGLHQPQLALDIAGSGDIHAAGQVDRLDAEIEGSGDLSLDGLTATDARVRIDGSGDAEVRVSNALTAAINGSGDIVYHGHPQQLARDINGSGSIRGR
jgi:hypothetical protein